MQNRTEYNRKYHEKRKKEDPNYIQEHYSRAVERMNSDPAILAARRYSKQMSAAKNERGIPWSLDKEKTIKLITESKTCRLSGRSLIFKIGHPDVPSIDRKNSKLGYTRRNIQITSAQINKAKGEMTDKEFVEMCHQVVENQKNSSKMRR
jgi:hypothetical protein